jgi:hypothetical protein
MIKNKSEIYTALGLMQPQQYLNYYRLGKYDRRSGTTTNMLIDALIKSQYGLVLIVGFSGDYTNRLRCEVLYYARQLGWSTQNIVLPNTMIPRFMTMTKYYSGRIVEINEYIINHSRYCVYEDHYRVYADYSQILRGT